MKALDMYRSYISSGKIVTLSIEITGNRHSFSVSWRKHVPSGRELFQVSTWKILLQEKLLYKNEHLDSPLQVRSRRRRE